MDFKPIHKVWIYLPVLLLVFGLGLFVSQIKRPQQLFTQASGGVILSMLKDKSGLRVGDEFTIDLVLDTKSSQVTNADIYLIYPESVLTAKSITAESFLPTVEDAGGVGPGTAFIRVSSSTPKTGTGVIASLKFRAKAAGSPSIQFTNESLVTDHTLPAGQVANLVDKAIGLTFDIK